MPGAPAATTCNSHYLGFVCNSEVHEYLEISPNSNHSLKFFSGISKRINLPPRFNHCLIVRRGVSLPGILMTWKKNFKFPLKKYAKEEIFRVPVLRNGFSLSVSPRFFLYATPRPLYKWAVCCTVSRELCGMFLEVWKIQANNLKTNFPLPFSLSFVYFKFSLALFIVADPAFKKSYKSDWTWCFFPASFPRQPWRVFFTSNWAKLCERCRMPENQPDTLHWTF